MRKKSLALGAAVFGLALVAGVPARADSYFEAVPTAWRLQDYLNGNIDVFFTPSTCTVGHVTMTTAASADSRNRFWSLILSAKMSGLVVGVYYDPATCYVTNFYAKEH